MAGENFSSEFNDLFKLLNSAVKNSARELARTADGAQKIREITLKNVEEELKRKVQRSSSAGEAMKRIGGSDLVVRLNQLETRIANMTAKAKIGAGGLMDDRTSRRISQAKDDLSAMQEIYNTMEEATAGNLSSKEVEQKLAETQLHTQTLIKQRENETHSELVRMLTTQINLNKESSLYLQNSLNVVKAKEKEILESEHMEKLFGVSKDQVKKMASDIEAVVKSPVAIAAYIAEAFFYVGDVLNDLRKQSGVVFSQIGELASKGISGALAGLRAGIIAGPKSAAEAVGALTKEYGRIDFLSSELVGNQLKLTKVYGLTGEEAAHLLRELDFIGNRTAGFTTHIISFARALAKTNELPVDELMSDMAKNSELLARYGSEGAEAFVRAAAAAHKIGIELSDLDKLADKALDPEAFLTDIQRVRQLTGMAFNDPVRMMMLANQNDLEGLSREIQKQLGGVNISSLNRIQQNALANLFGMSVEELQRITHSAQMGQLGKLQAPTSASFRGETMDNLMSSFGNAIDGLKSLVGQLAKLVGVLAAFVIAKGAGGMISGLLGRIPGIASLPLIGKFFGGGALEMTPEALAMGGAASTSGLLGSLGGLGGLARGAGVAGGAISGGMAAFDIGKTALQGGNIGKAFERHLFTGIGAGIGLFGGPVGMAIGAGIGGLIDSMAGLGRESAPTGTGAAEATAQPVEIHVNTSNVEMKLDELINLFKSGQISVTMDGKKVGHVVYNSFARV